MKNWQFLLFPVLLITFSCFPEVKSIFSPGVLSVLADSSDTAMLAAGFEANLFDGNNDTCVTDASFHVIQLSKSVLIVQATIVHDNQLLSIGVGSTNDMSQATSCFPLTGSNPESFCTTLVLADHLFISDFFGINAIVCEVTILGWEEPPAPNATNFLSLPQMMYHPTDGWTATLNIFYTDEVYILLPKTKVTKSFGSQTPVIITDPSFVPLADEDEVRAMQPNTDYKISVTRVHDDVTGVQVEGPAYKTTVSRSPICVSGECIEGAEKCLEVFEEKFDKNDIFAQQMFDKGVCLLFSYSTIDNSSEIHALENVEHYASAPTNHIKGFKYQDNEESLCFQYCNFTVSPFTTAPNNLFCSIVSSTHCCEDDFCLKPREQPFLSGSSCAHLMLVEDTSLTYLEDCLNPTPLSYKKKTETSGTIFFYVDELVTSFDYIKISFFDIQKEDFVNSVSPVVCTDGQPFTGGKRHSCEISFVGLGESSRYVMIQGHNPARNGLTGFSKIFALKDETKTTAADGKRSGASPGNDPRCTGTLLILFHILKFVKLTK